jgi:septal ring factor EnvC (AmiA/AmiB activator)
MEESMKRMTLIVLAALVALSLSGCFSTGFMGFLATTEQVDKKVAAQDEKLAKELVAQKAELAKVQQELADVQTMKEQAQAAVDELKATAKKVEERMSTLPKETLMKLVDILQTALSQE